MAVVAKGVSPPALGLWLVSFFASSETESAAQPGRALGFYRPCRGKSNHAQTLVSGLSADESSGLPQASLKKRGSSPQQTSI